MLYDKLWCVYPTSKRQNRNSSFATGDKFARRHEPLVYCTCFIFKWIKVKLGHYIVLDFSEEVFFFLMGSSFIRYRFTAFNVLDTSLDPVY